MRESCIYCVSKHISQAIVLVIESALGYPLHIWYAVGHLAEAETESLHGFSDLAEEIRAVRVKLMGQEPGFDPLSLVKLLERVRETAAIINGYDETERVFKILNGEELPEHGQQNKL